MHNIKIKIKKNKCLHFAVIADILHGGHEFLDNVILCCVQWIICIIDKSQERPEYVSKNTFAIKKHATLTQFHSIFGLKTILILIKFIQ